MNSATFQLFISSQYGNIPNDVATGRTRELVLVSPILTLVMDLMSFDSSLALDTLDSRR